MVFVDSLHLQICFLKEKNELGSTGCYPMIIIRIISSLCNKKPMGKSTEDEIRNS